MELNEDKEDELVIEFRAKAFFMKVCSTKDDEQSSKIEERPRRALEHKIENKVGDHEAKAEGLLHRAMVQRIGIGLSEMNSTEEVDQEVKMQFPLRYIEEKFESGWDSTKRSAQNFEALEAVL